ncbi:nuclear pore complex protein Nup155-like isoform X2 [Festucalex cinctus]
MVSSTGPSSAALDQDLDSSAQLVDRYLQYDRSFPDLSDLISVSAHNLPSLSGRFVRDYPLQSPRFLCKPNFPELDNGHTVPLPAQLVEQFSHVQFNNKMGVFPEISRAWLTIANVIFMWNYENGGDVTSFGSLTKTIRAVGLVKAKQGILQSDIRYLLVLATSGDVSIMGVKFPENQAGLNDMFGGTQLLLDPLYSIPTGNAHILSVTSTDLGRIFMAGKNGCLYEITYQSQRSSLDQHCRLANHSKSCCPFHLSFSCNGPIVQIAVDNSRNTLYTRSKKGVLQVYDLGADGWSMKCVASMSENDIATAAAGILRKKDRSVLKPIIHISVISRSESSNCHLLAVTNAGVRLYFCTTPFVPPDNKTKAPPRPSMLSLIHVRLLPDFSALSTLQRPATVHKVLHSKGIFLMATSETDDSDLLWCISQDSFPFKKPLMETQSISYINGHICAISAIEERVDRICTPLNKDRIPVSDMPAVVLQHRIAPQKIVVLSTKGSYIFQKLRPVEKLRHLLESCKGGESKQIEYFFSLHQEDQSCATALILACSTAACNRRVSEWATRAFFRYGGEAQKRVNTAVPPFSNVGPSSPAVDISPPPLATPIAPTQSGSAPITPMSAEVIFSGKHNGVYVYFARILGNIWDGSLAVEKTDTESQTDSRLESSVASFHLESVLLELYHLKEFLDQNLLFSLSSLRGVSSPGNLQQRPLEFMQLDGAGDQQGLRRNCTAQVSEVASLQSIQALMHHSYQTIMLWKLLCDHQFSLIMLELPKDFQKQMTKTSFKDVVIRGKELLGALIAGLIHVYIKNNASVDAIDSTYDGIYDNICSQVNSPNLISMMKQDQNKIYYMDLLWRFYEKNHNVGKAARVLACLADMHSTEISLMQRLNYLARAIDSLTQATDDEFLHELEEKMKVGRIQVKIQETLLGKHSDDPWVKNGICQLNLELMDITKLFREYVDHFRLSECKLALIHCMGHPDSTLVHSTWEDIIEKELEDTVGKNTQYRMQTLNLKLVSLGKIYAETPDYFPLEFLIKFLEEKVCQLRWGVDFVLSTMQDLGVKLLPLLEVYIQLFRAGRLTRPRPLHSLECIQELLKLFVNDLNRVPTSDRCQFISMCRDNINYLKEELSQSPNGRLKYLINNFKDLQPQLEKLRCFSPKCLYCLF